jgi:hypothetical protein
VNPTKKIAVPKKPEPKFTVATKPAAGKPKKKAAASVKIATAKPTTPDLVVLTQTSNSTLLPSQRGSPPADCLQTLILVVDEYGSTI